MRVSCAIIAAVALTLGTSLTGQEFTDEQLLERFETQREAFRQAQSSDLGQTRGLKLITVEDASATAGAELAASATSELRPLAPPSSSGGSAGPEIAEAAATETDGPLVFGALDPEFQVNLQIEFAFDSAVVEPSQIVKLEQMCRVMKESDIQLFRVVGHTDAAGTEEYNKQLSMLRSREVARYLVNDCGLSPSRIETVGLGEQFLANPTAPRAGENRRVEFQALG